MSVGAEEIYDDGPLYESAKKVYPQRVSGTYRRLKWIVLWTALGVYYILPFIRWNRGPHLPDQAVLADIAHSRFYFFFVQIWPQEGNGPLLLHQGPVQACRPSWLCRRDQPVMLTIRTRRFRGSSTWSRVGTRSAS